MFQCTVSIVGSKSLLCFLPGYLPYPSVLLVIIHIFSWLFLWEPWFWFLGVLLVTYFIFQRPPVSWWGALYLPLYCSLPPRTAIPTLASFGSFPYSSCPWSRALHQPLSRLPWRCLVFLTLFSILWRLWVSSPPPPTVPLCPGPGFIVGVLWGGGHVARLCLLAHFIRCWPWVSLNGDPTSFPPSQW